LDSITGLGLLIQFLK